METIKKRYLYVTNGNGGYMVMDTVDRTNIYIDGISEEMAREVQYALNYAYFVGYNQNNIHKEIEKDLPVKAIDNFGREYNVKLIMRDNAAGSGGTPEATAELNKKFGYKWTVQIEGCGSWYLTSLVQHPNNKLAIDIGQGWYCVNIQDVIKAALEAA